MSKAKIKLYSIAGVLTFVAIVLSNSQAFVSSADGDELVKKIAGYRSWKKLTNKPNAVNFTSVLKQPLLQTPPESNSFSIDGAAGGG